MIIIKNFTYLALLFSFVGCSGKYLVKTYPSNAKVYTRDIKTKEKQLIGLSPLQVGESSKLGDVFFLVFEKQNYKPKEVMIRANEGESIAIMAQLDPLSPDDLAAQSGDESKKDDKKPQSQPKKKDKKKDLEKEMEELQLRVALVENTLSFYKDAMFSPRFNGSGHARFDRDRNDKVISYMFNAQQAILSKKYDKAEGFIEKALKKDEYMSKAWMLKGSVAYLKKDYLAARKAWERTLKIDPHDKHAYHYLSKVYQILKLGDLPENPAAMRYPASLIEIEKRK